MSKGNVANFGKYVHELLLTKLVEKTTSSSSSSSSSLWSQEYKYITIIVTASLLS